MTRTEFINNVNTIQELMEFAYQNGIEFYDSYDITDSCCRDEYLNDNLVEWARDHEWRDLLNILQQEEAEDGYEYYVWDDWNCRYRGVTDYDIPDIKDCILNMADDQDIWDADDNDGHSSVDPQESENDDSDEDFEIETGITIFELITSSVECMADAPPDDAQLDA